MPSILVVDDDRAVQEMLEDLLIERGYQVNTCRDGNQVIPELSRTHYDLLILDVLVPHKNGFVLIDMIRSDPALSDLPVIMISGIYRSRNHRSEMAANFEVIEYLDKPLPTDRLLELIQQVVGEPNPAAEPAALSAEDSIDFVDPEDIIDAEDASLGGVQTPVNLGAPKQKPVTLTRQKLRRESSGRKAGAKPPAPPPPPDEKLVDLTTRAEKKDVESEARQAFRTSAFVLQGSIKKMPVVAVLGKLWHERASGGLLLRQGKVKKIVYLRRGHPYLVKSNLVQECLGKILLRERMIQPLECEQSVEGMKQTGQRQGEVLVEMGCLTEKNLRFALELQLETKLFDTFAWETGEYRFNTSVQMPDASIRLEWTGPTIVVEGIRQTFDETRLRGLMIPVIDVPLGFVDQLPDLSQLGFTETEREAIESIVPPRTTRELLSTMHLVPPDALRVIYSLIALNILAPAT